MSEYCEFEWNSTRHGYKIGSYIDTKNKNKKMNINWNEPTDRSCALIALRELIGASIDYALKDKSCCHDDEFLMRFLYARKFNVDEAFQLIINYHAYRQRNATILQRLSALDEPIQVSLRDGFPGVLKERDRRGRKILVFFAANWDHCTYSLISVYRAMLLSLEKLLDDKQNQANGFVAIVDWTNFTLRQSSHLNPKILKLMIEGLQDCFPVRFKAVHFIGQPWYVEAALAVIRPFLKEKTRARIKLHGSNLSTLHECIAREILPPELGGEGPAFNPLDWFHTLLESSQTITTPRPYCITQPAVYSKPPSTYKKPSMLSNNNNSNHKNSNNNNHHNSNNNNNNNNNSDPARNTLLGINDDLM